VRSSVLPRHLAPDTPPPVTSRPGRRRSAILFGLALLCAGLLIAVPMIVVLSGPSDDGGRTGDDGVFSDKTEPGTGGQGGADIGTQAVPSPSPGAAAPAGGAATGGGGARSGGTGGTGGSGGAGGAGGAGGTGATGQPGAPGQPGQPGQPGEPGQPAPDPDPDPDPEPEPAPLPVCEVPVVNGLCQLPGVPKP
jgi:hypothetical protein